MPEITFLRQSYKFTTNAITDTYNTKSSLILTSRSLIATHFVQFDAFL